MVVIMMVVAAAIEKNARRKKSSSTYYLSVLQLLVSVLWISSSRCVLASPLQQQQQQQHARSYCYTYDTEPYQEFATKTPYEYSRGHFYHSELVPQGCVEARAWHLIRHGTRYPQEEDIQSFISKLPDLQMSVLKAHQEGKGSLCEGDLGLLSRWTLGGLNSSWASKLAHEGELELQGLASRYKDALPSLLDQKFSNESFKFRHTAAQRTEASANFYAKGLFGDESVYIPPALDPDPLLKFYEVCEKYIVEVDENPDAEKEGNLFWMGTEVEEVLNQVSRRLGYDCTRDDLELLYDACRFYQAWQPAGPSPWCVAFTPHHLQVLEYHADLEHYYTSGYGYNINTEMACPPLQDVYQYFSDAVEGIKEGPQGIFYFTHSKAINTVMSRLGLYQDASPLTHDHMDEGRLWRTSKHSSFAANLAFTLSKCTGDRWWVSVASSERMESLEGCEGPSGCSWDDFTKALADSRNCDLGAICAVKNAESGVAGSISKGWMEGIVTGCVLLVSFLSAGLQ